MLEFKSNNSIHPHHKTDIYIMANLIESFETLNDENNSPNENDLQSAGREAEEMPLEAENSQEEAADLSAGATYLQTREQIREQMIAGLSAATPTDLNSLQQTASVFSHKLTDSNSTTDSTPTPGDPGTILKLARAEKIQNGVRGRLKRVSRNERIGFSIPPFKERIRVSEIGRDFSNVL